MGIIYEALNVTNGKRYIGRTVTTLHKRKQQHLRDPSTKGFHGALKKYGADTFQWAVLETVEDDQLNDRERFYIDKLRAYVGFDDCNGYNLTLGGDGASPGKLNPWSQPEVIEKLRAARIGKVSVSIEARVKIANALRGRKIPAHVTAKVVDSIRKNREAGLHKAKDGAHSPLAKAWIVIFPDGTEREILGLRSFCRDHGLSAKLLRAVANNKFTHHKGFKLRAA